MASDVYDIPRGKLTRNSVYNMTVLLVHIYALHRVRGLDGVSGLEAGNLRSK